MLNGEYGHKDLCLGVPILLSKNGIEKVIELEITLTEKEAFDKSASVVRNTMKSLELESEKTEGSS
jgi:malate/lactate dehydrogenase